MLSNTVTLTAARMFGAAALLVLAGCTGARGPGADSDSGCASACDAADADGGDDGTDASDGASDGGDGDGGGGDGSDHPYLVLTWIEPRENAVDVPVNVVLEATFVFEERLTSDDVYFGLYLPPDYDNVVPATTDLYDEGRDGDGLSTARVTLTPDEPLLYATVYYALVAAGYSSASSSGSWNFTTTAE